MNRLKCLRKNMDELEEVLSNLLCRTIFNEGIIFETAGSKQLITSHVSSISEENELIVVNCLKYANILIWKSVSII